MRRGNAASLGTANEQRTSTAALEGRDINAAICIKTDVTSGQSWPPQVKRVIGDLNGWTSDRTKSYSNMLQQRLTYNHRFWLRLKSMYAYIRGATSTRLSISSQNFKPNYRPYVVANLIAFEVTMTYECVYFRLKLIWNTTKQYK